jgi:hypothetical protein
MRVTNKLPNNEINKLVAEKVMGFFQYPDSDEWDLGKAGSGSVRGKLPDFAGSLTVAEQVIQEMERRGFAYGCNATHADTVCCFTRNTKTFSATGPDLPRAICIAALAAVEDE